ncbi:hypothetical protein LTR78_005153 [Recurvomyces mirabilis]|uniref:Uncharacterized protein n=1 Tax=Recurvomyces mirabilis TaxID=574656 RepID=A0AAE0WND6_9PEZI|nr:hypothetical protein LTR78_005153 [Recurvomyces mirabilis]KAK5157703.1 hypothetical protein LTS14_003625 [Recurvomyces mirabilis]
MSTATSATTIFSLPSEIIVAINEHNRHQHTIASQYIGITPLAPDDTNGLRHSSQHLKRVFDSKLYGSAEFFYSSSGSGNHNPHLRHPSAAADLLHWFDGLGEPVNGRRVRNLSLEMYGPEFLLLFAPPEAASLLNLPAGRGDWARAARRLRALCLNRLTIRVLAETCPRPCSAGKSNHVKANSDGSTPTHFVADPVWAVKAVLETWLPHLSEYCDVQLFTAHRGQATQPTTTPLTSLDLERIKLASWNTLHIAVDAWHTCDTLDVYANAPDTTILHKAAPVIGDWDKSPSPFLGPKDRPEGIDRWDWSCFPLMGGCDVDMEVQIEEWQCPGPYVANEVGSSGMTSGDEWEAVAEAKGYRIPVVFVGAKRRAALREHGGRRDVAEESLGREMGLASLGL